MLVFNISFQIEPLHDKSLTQADIQFEGKRNKTAAEAVLRDSMPLRG